MASGHHGLCGRSSVCLRRICARHDRCCLCDRNSACRRMASGHHGLCGRSSVCLRRICARHDRCCLCDRNSACRRMASGHHGLCGRSSVCLRRICGCHGLCGRSLTPPVSHVLWNSHPLHARFLYADVLLCVLLLHAPLPSLHLPDHTHLLLHQHQSHPQLHPQNPSHLQNSFHPQLYLPLRTPFCHPAPYCPAPYCPASSYPAPSFHHFLSSQRPSSVPSLRHFPLSYPALNPVLPEA